jgi:hypothetical protein
MCVSGTSLRFLQRLEFYRERYENHLDGLKFAEEQLGRALEKTVEMTGAGLVHAADDFLVTYVH